MQRTLSSCTVRQCSPAVLASLDDAEHLMSALSGFWWYSSRAHHCFETDGSHRSHRNNSGSTIQLTQTVSPGGQYSKSSSIIIITAHFCKWRDR